MKNELIKDEKTGAFGYKKCPAWLRKAYLSAVNYQCQECKRNLKLIPHRITRGNSGGLYTVAKLDSKQNNVKIVCEDCHKAIHSGEFK